VFNYGGSAMKSFYFTYPKYLFLGFLFYVLYVMSELPDVDLGAQEIIFGIVFPFIPVLLSTYFAKKSDVELSDSLLNWFALSSPSVVIGIEAYFIFTLTLTDGGTGLGLLAAFGAGGIAFFILLCTTMFLSVFANPPKKPAEQDN
jgi:hypothetical protein